MPTIQKSEIRSQKSEKKTGFTLIELLVTITIISIISAIGFTTYTNAQIAGRDGRRKQDLRSIATALELYYQENKYYPCSPNNGNWEVSTSSNFNQLAHNSDGPNPGTTACPGPGVTFGTNYINQAPIDPSRNTAAPMTNGGYGYKSYFTGAGCTPGQQYVLITLLENTSDPDRLELKQNKDCTGTVFPVGSTYKNNDYIITSY